MLEIIKRLIPKKLFAALQPTYHFIFSWLAALAYFFPSRRLIVIGVTGTAGKTSTVYLIAKLLSEAGCRTGFTSTTVFSDGRREWLNDRKMTMPGRFFIQRQLKQMVRNDCRYAVIETSSEGIKQFRHRFINYDVLVFTNLYPEHIEAHGSFERYQATKGRLFARLLRGVVKYSDVEKNIRQAPAGLGKLDLSRIRKTTIINGVDPAAEYFLNFPAEAKIVYSAQPAFNLEPLLKNLNSEAIVKDFQIVESAEPEVFANGVRMVINGLEINLKLLGAHNAVNALAAYAVGLSQGIAPEQMKAGLEAVTNLAGKLEAIEAGQDFTALVDYSFEPVALEKLYQTIELLPHQQTIHLLGSTGGGRDKARRQVLGRLAGSKADLVIVTNEDPYDEDPQVIIKQVAAGAEDAGKIPGKDLFLIPDRRVAIRKALQLAKKDDLVLFTGKGAEQYICLAKGQKMPWDERQEVRLALEELLEVDKK